MCCSDYPHSEGKSRPLADYAAPGKLAVHPDDAPGRLRDNAVFLLRSGCDFRRNGPRDADCRLE